MAYLDNAGLSYLLSKVKTLFAKKEYADAFSQRGAKGNYVSNVLQINTNGNMDSAYMQDGYINSSTSYISEMLNAVNNYSDAVSNLHAYRKIHVIPKKSGGNPYIMVEVIEVYPTPGREYYNVYNGSYWSGWWYRESEVTV